MSDQSFTYVSRYVAVVSDIEITDLADPDYTELQESIRRYGETLEVDFDRDRILADAATEVSLDDYGPDDFVERLDRICAEWDADAGLTGVGRLNLRSRLVDHARNRLLVFDFLRRNPEVHDERIKAPIIVVGLPRTGTTHLVNLLAADSRLRAMPLWESEEPVPRPGDEPLPDGSDPRYQRAADAWEMTQQTVPLLAAMHPLDPDSINEEIELMLPDFSSYNYEWFTPSPRWRDFYYESDQLPHYEFMAKMLGLLQFQQPPEWPKRWVLKSPMHLENLPELVSVFPDATFVVTYRDPVSVVQSAMTMLGYGQRMSRDRPDLAGLADYWPARIERLLQRFEETFDALPPERTVAVHFADFMADNAAAVARVHATAGLAETERSKQEAADYVAANPRGKHGRIVYNLERDFGIAPAELRERFGFYLDAFGVQPEG